MNKKPRNSKINAPYVTVIIPTFNGKERLLLLLESLEDQSVQDFEVIVVDDGSDDGTRELVIDMMARYPVKLRYYYLDNAKIFGAGMARNHGAEHAQGTILLFLDQDCVAERGLIERHIFEQEEKDVVLGYYAGYGNENCHYEFSDLRRHVQTREAISIIQEFREQLFQRECNPDAWKCFVSAHFSIKKTIFDGVRFDESFTRWGCEDVDLGYRLYLERQPIHFVRDCVAFDSSGSTKLTQQKFLDLAQSLIAMHSKYLTEEIKLYCYERFYHSPLECRGFLQLTTQDNALQLIEFDTRIFIRRDFQADIVMGRDVLDAKYTIEQMIPLFRSVHFDIGVIQDLSQPSLSGFLSGFRQLLKVLKNNAMDINWEHIKRQLFLGERGLTAATAFAVYPDEGAVK